MCPSRPPGERPRAGRVDHERVCARCQIRRSVMSPRIDVAADAYFGTEQLKERSGAVPVELRSMSEDDRWQCATAVAAVADQTSAHRLRPDDATGNSNRPVTKGIHVVPVATRERYVQPRCADEFASPPVRPLEKS